MSAQPSIKRQIDSRLIKANRPFHFTIRKFFNPPDIPLTFELVEAPYWLKLDATTGIISGQAPTRAHDRQFLVTVKAKNNDGEVSQSFFIKVVEIDIVEAYAQKLEQLHMLRNRIHSINAQDIPYLHEILEYLYEFLLSSNEKDSLLNQLKEKAAELNIRISPEIEFSDFKKVIAKMNPEVMKELQGLIVKEHLTINAELSNREFSNLYRQGSAPAGSHVIAVWNYLAFADYHRWSEVKNVLDAAADRIIELKQTTQHQQEVTEHVTPTPRPKR